MLALNDDTFHYHARIHVIYSYSCKLTICKRTDVPDESSQKIRLVRPTNNRPNWINQMHHSSSFLPPLHTAIVRTWPTAVLRLISHCRRRPLVVCTNHTGLLKIWILDRCFAARSHNICHTFVRTTSPMHITITALQRNMIYMFGSVWLGLVALWCATSTAWTRFYSGILNRFIWPTHKYRAISRLFRRFDRRLV